MIFVLVLACATCGSRAAGKRRGAGKHVDAGAQTHAPVPRVTPKTLPEVAPPAQMGLLTRGGTLRVHLEVEPPHLNPLLDTHQVIQRTVNDLVYEPLLECRADRYGQRLAESWEVSQDGTKITLKLRNGARWHDDRMVTGIDVQATFEQVLRVAGAHVPSVLHAMAEDIEGVDVLSDRGVRIRLRRSSDLALRALCEIPILPAEPLRKGGATLAQLGRQPVGTGPFRFASWERGKRIKLVRNGPGDGSHPPYLDEIVFEIDNDGARALVRTRRGEIDVLPRLLEVLYPEQVSPATLRDSLDLFWLTPDRYSFIIPNRRHGALADASFRHALSLLWDRARFSEELHRGMVRPVGAPTFGKVEPDPFDRAAATELLEKTGFRDTDGDGVRDIGGVPVRLTFLVPNSARTLTAEVRAFALDLRRAGILLDSVNLEPSALMGRLERGDFDLATLTWEGMRDEDPRPIFGPQGELSLAGPPSDRLQALLDGLPYLPGPLLRAPALQAIAELLATERPVIFLYRHDVPALVSKRVHGLAGVGDRLDFRNVWVSP